VTSKFGVYNKGFILRHCVEDLASVMGFLLGLKGLHIRNLLDGGTIGAFDFVEFGDMEHIETSISE
jgi:hypothetical protein